MGEWHRDNSHLLEKCKYLFYKKHWAVRAIALAEGIQETDVVKLLKLPKYSHTVTYKKFRKENT